MTQPPDCDQGIYQPLGSYHTRVVRIYGGRTIDEFELELIVVDLEELVPKTKHPYTALSYTWGTTLRDVKLAIRNSNGDEHAVWVTQSLIPVIRAIRQAEKSVDLW